MFSQWSLWPIHLVPIHYYPPLLQIKQKPRDWQTHEVVRDPDFSIVLLDHSYSVSATLRVPPACGTLGVISTCRATEERKKGSQKSTPHISIGEVGTCGHPVELIVTSNKLEFLYQERQGDLIFNRCQISLNINVSTVLM